MTKMDQLNLQQVLCEMEDKYHTLVWYARSYPPGHPDHAPAAMAPQMEAQDRYPKETAAIGSDAGEWHHGFNSGMLAALRFMLTAMDSDSEFGGLHLAREEFPMLDT